jgi:hypothetical protein
MKAKTLLVGTCLVFIGLTSHAKESVQIRIKLDSATDYQQQNANVFVGQTDSVDLSMSVVTTDSTGNVQTEGFGPMKVSGQSTDKLTILGDQVISENAGVKTVVKAMINEAEMRISSQEMLRASSEALKAKGKALVSNLNLKTEDGEMGFQLKVSDLVCKNAVPMVCTLSVEMLIQAER